MLIIYCVYITNGSLILGVNVTGTCGKLLGVLEKGRVLVIRLIEIVTGHIRGNGLHIFYILIYNLK